MRYFLLPAFCFVLAGCSWSGPRRPSFLIIAVESLNFDNARCESVPPDGGMAEICQSSVRFTHAFTPSLMSQATLASVLTGKYPYEHGVRNNGSDFLSAKFETAAELAVKAGYRTSFFSGGPPIWSKSGLNQGFEDFDDNIDLHLSHLYRGAKENFASFIDWLDDTSRKQPYFSVIFLPDLQFPDVTTHTEGGEIRSRGVSSQIREVDEALAILIKELQRRGLWNNTYVFLMGLNGLPDHVHLHEVNSYSLFSENTQVALFIKPATKNRDLGMAWKIDKSVSLVDVGATLFDLLGQPVAGYDSHNLEIVSLRKSLESPIADWNDDRILLLESAWPLWRGVSSIRYAVRERNLLYVYDDHPQLYNTLTDRFEQIPVTIRGSGWEPQVKRLQEFMVSHGFLKWSPLPNTLVQKLQIGRDLWRRGQPALDVRRRLRQLISDRTWDNQLQGWLAQLELQEQNWQGLMELGKTFERPLWSFLAARRLGRPFNKRLNGCARLFVGKVKQRISPAMCSDPLFVTLVHWASHDQHHQAQAFQEKFLRSYLYELIDKKIHRLNYINNLKWDVVIDRPGPPTYTDLYLNLPGKAALAASVAKRVQHELAR